MIFPTALMKRTLISLQEVLIMKINVGHRLVNAVHMECEGSEKYPICINMYMYFLYVVS